MRVQVQVYLSTTRDCNLDVVSHANLAKAHASADIGEEEGNCMQPGFKKLCPVEEEFQTLHHLCSRLLDFIRQ